MTRQQPLTVVGIGADGWAGLGEPARAAIVAAPVTVGSERQLAMLPEDLQGERRAWPSPIEPLVAELAGGPERPTCVLASGDPMLHGIGATLARRRGGKGLEVHPHPSAFAYTCARMGWPAAEVELVSAVAGSLDAVARSLQPGRRLVVYCVGADGAAQLAGLLVARGYGASALTALEQLGAGDERRADGTAAAWPGEELDPLHVVAVDCRPDAGTPLLPRVPGLPDDAYDHDGQLTKRHVRAATLATLAPAPGQLLWDVGAGSGSIAIEWLRAEPTARAVAIEARQHRAARVSANAARLGVPGLEVRCARAPAALGGLEAPDAVFIGGGLWEPGLLDLCLEALLEGGRLVANAVTLEGEALLAAARAAHGGELCRISVDRAEPVGRFTAWRAQMPVVQWVLERP